MVRREQQAKISTSGIKIEIVPERKARVREIEAERERESF